MSWDGKAEELPRWLYTSFPDPQAHAVVGTGESTVPVQPGVLLSAEGTRGYKPGSGLWGVAVSPGPEVGPYEPGQTFPVLKFGVFWTKPDTWLERGSDLFVTPEGRLTEDDTGVQASNIQTDQETYQPGVPGRFIITRSTI